MAVDTITDAEALDAIAHMLRDPEWGMGMLEDIDQWVTATGRSTAETCGLCGHVVLWEYGCEVDGCGCVEHEPEQTWDRH